MKLMGCTTPPKEPHRRGPEFQELYVNTCPANVIGHDIQRLANRYHLADGRISFSEQARLPFPYLQALHVYRNELIAKQEHQARAERAELQLARMTAGGRR